MSPTPLVQFLAGVHREVTAQAGKVGFASGLAILSQDRADAVRQYLVSNFRYDPEKVSSVGYGEARPVATNETAAGRARNRRIEILLTPEVQVKKPAKK